MSARSIIREGFYELLIKYSNHLVCEGCNVEHRIGWLEAINWLDEREQLYEHAPFKEEIREYHRQLNEHTKDARKYAHLTREEVQVLYTLTFASQRKRAIEWYALQRTKALFIAAPPEELQFEEKPSLKKLKEIRIAQSQRRKYDSLEADDIPRIFKEIARVENKDELLRRKFIRNRQLFL